MLKDSVTLTLTLDYHQDLIISSLAHVAPLFLGRHVQICLLTYFRPNFVKIC